MPSRVVLFGLDGATWRLLRPWVDDGELPTLAQFREEGVTGTLHSTIPSNTCPAVPALYTGRDPAQTGIFDFVKPDGSSVTARDFKNPKLWSVLNRHGMDSCVVNLRVTYPPDDLDGVMITGFPTPGEDSQYTHPPELKDSVTGFQFDEEEAELRELTEHPYENAERMLELRGRMLTERYDVFQNLVAEGDYALSIFWIGGTDFLQHWLWDDRDTLLSFYTKVDDVLASLLEEFDGNVVVVSDHGFESRSERRFHVNEWLRREGYLSVVGGGVGNRVLGLLQGVARRYVPPSYLHSIVRAIPSRHEDLSTNSTSVVDRSIKNIPGVSTESEAMLATRWGIDVDATGHRRAELVDEIVDGLTTLTTPDGSSVVKDAWPREEVYTSGEYLDAVPDVIFQPETEFYTEGQLSSHLFTPRVGKAGTQDGRMFNGEHEADREGILLASGPDIGSSRTVHASITDIAPTLLHLLDASVPDSMHGSVLDSLFASGSDADLREPEYESYLEDDQRFDEPTIDREDEELEQRLKDMGYL